MAGVAYPAERRTAERWQSAARAPMSGGSSAPEKRAGIIPSMLKETTTAGVRTDIITPLTMPEANRNRVLINLHGGGFNSDSGSLIEGIPIANLAKIKVVSVYYRLAPENPFPAAVDDVVAVYKELLKTYKPDSIGIFGTSAGAILTAEVAVRLKQLGLPLPAALGIFSGLGDFSRLGDSRQLFTLNGFPGEMQPIDPNHLPDDQYVGKTDRKDPVLSPLFADLHGHAAQPAGHQHARHSVERYDYVSSRAAAGGSRCAPRRVRGAAACLLVSLPVAGNQRGAGTDGEVLRRKAGAIDSFPPRIHGGIMYQKQLLRTRRSTDVIHGVAGDSASR